jgi:hypothetical protein
MDNRSIREWRIENRDGLCRPDIYLQVAGEKQDGRKDKKIRRSFAATGSTRI